MKSELEQIEIPGEHEARERTWTIVQAAFAARQPVERRPRLLRPALALAVGLAVVGAAFTPPGQAVVDEIREVVGVERAQPALFSLPSPGRLLVASDTGVWVVQQDGSKRRLGDYREASWSPFGRFVVAARENELVALEPDGTVRWTLARRGAGLARWTGTETNTRIAYVSAGQPRVVAGDGTDDQPVCAVSTHPRVAPAWRPGPGFVLALAAPSGIVQLVDLDTCSRVWFTSPIRSPRRLEWSSDGRRLLVVTLRDVMVLEAVRGTVVRVVAGTDAVFRPGSTARATIRHRGEASELVVGNRVLFRGTGEFSELAWSPDGKWILVAWPTADQWVFVRADGKRIRAVANVFEQFRTRAFPRIEGWCCGP